MGRRDTSFNFRGLQISWSDDVVGPNAGRGRGTNPSPSAISRQPKCSTSNHGTTMGPSFDSFDYSSLLSLIISTSATAIFPSIANFVGDVFNAPVLLPTTEIDGAQIVLQRNAPLQASLPVRRSEVHMSHDGCGETRRAHCTPAETGRGGFEEGARRLLAKRWAATGGAPLRTNINGPSSGSKAASMSGSGTSTPYGNGARFALGPVILVEEEEEEIEEMEKTGENGMQNSLGIGSGYGESDAGRMRALTSFTVGNAMTGSMLDGPSTAFTTSDLNGINNPNSETAATDTTVQDFCFSLTHSRRRHANIRHRNIARSGEGCRAGCCHISTASIGII